MGPRKATLVLNYSTVQIRITIEKVFRGSITGVKRTKGARMTELVLEAALKWLKKRHRRNQVFHQRNRKQVKLAVRPEQGQLPSICRPMPAVSIHLSEDLDAFLIRLQNESK